MKITIEIPTEFENDYLVYRFKEFFERVMADMDSGILCGNYEKEIAEMFLKSFNDSSTNKEIGELIMEKMKKECVDVNIDHEWRKVVCLDDIGNIIRNIFSR